MRTEVYLNGVCINAEIIHLDANLYQREEMGVIVESRPLTNEERIKYGPQPLDAVGAIATLNAVVGVWPLADAANAVGLTEQDLINEAQAWAVAGES